MMNTPNKIWFVVSLLFVFIIGSSASAEGILSVASTTGSIFTRNLYLGTRGDDVSALQQFLIAGKYLKISTSTGYFGPLTTTALHAWQASVGISPSVGFFGPASREKINPVMQPTPINTTGTQSTAGATTTAPTKATIITEATSTNIASSENGSPVRLIIPTLNIDTSFQDTGLKPDGTMEVPSTIYVVGWFTGSARPGEKGVAIVTGHVAQIRGGIVTKPGVFSNLYEINIGDKLSVVNDEGKTIDFIVRKVRSYDPVADATDVFTSTDGGAHLNIITCEGTWISAQLSYTQRLVVFTDAVQ